MSTALLATPSPSIKRPSPATSSQTLKRPRHASVSFTDMGNDSGTSDNEGGDDERAKIARKEARVIRNRQSAQRSRNARKLHLQHLEKRVVELEAENQALKSNPKASPTPLVSHSTLPSASPATSSDLDMFSFAHDLGLPSQLVGGGVNLTSVAPPPADVKDSFEPSPLSLSPTMASTSEQVDSLQAENAALKQRVTLLENLVKQVVAVANLSGQSQPPANLSSQAPIDWLSVFTSPSAATTSGLSSTLSPGLPPTVSSFPTSHTNLASRQESLNPSACHSAVVVTSPAALSRGKLGAALQRARGATSMRSLAVALARDERRLRQVARVIVALAKQRGWISPYPRPSMVVSSWKSSLGARARGRTGMRR
ncbi:hypothetical protein L202_04981 [Cryptococcus amylolentus CBS 6039]|uniref:BZIP domain-containing protein n=1 Tax=Cryptococcus amylolentus CBS 6039 TaxID=1295533 RepID=A0A1E3HNF0_9TREE|nr:hypothetical protein L202_04981 [Cryptococcus amylolentus CBS 6039]ODN77867.1 hypothetical protein L202_04981 [Cryptococcus amylolentus CBS 6039]